MTMYCPVGPCMREVLISTPDKDRYLCPRCGWTVTAEDLVRHGWLHLAVADRDRS